MTVNIWQQEFYAVGFKKFLQFYFKFDNLLNFRGKTKKP